jgi:hypothetical protein
MISILPASFAQLAVFAYIDPGTGSMIFQAAIAMMLSVGIFFKQIKMKVQSMFSTDKPRIQNSGEPPSEPPAAT